MKVKDVAFYKSDYVLTIGYPYVITHVFKKKGSHAFSSDIFVLYPYPRDRKLLYQHQHFEYPIDAEAVEIAPVKVDRKLIVEQAKEEGRSLIQGVKEHIRSKQECEDPQLLRECVLTDCDPHFLVELWMRGFTKETLEALRNKTGSADLKKYLDGAFQMPRFKFDEPYSSSDEIGN